MSFHDTSTLTMAQPMERYVNVIPTSRLKIKKEAISDDEDAYHCRLCWKGFVSEVALTNHARMEHIDSFATGDPSVWTQVNDKATKVKPEDNIIKMKTDQLFSEMEPTSVMALASNDVSYIIIKADDGTDVKRRKIDRVGKKDKEEKPAQKKEKESEPITSRRGRVCVRGGAGRAGVALGLGGRGLGVRARGRRSTASDRPGLHSIEEISLCDIRELPVGQGPESPLHPSRKRRWEQGPFECLQPSTLVADGTCHQIFFSCCEYSIHYRDEHTRRRKGLRCQVCEKPLACTGEEPPAPFTCEVCGTGYQTSKELSEHTAIAHLKLKPFECNVCHKRFTQHGGVLQHMRMHTGDRPFPCTFCSKAFTQKSGLDQHLRIHTKVKPYRCVVCNKTFCQSVHLKQHMRTHTNVAPFQCGICDKRFKQSSHLNYHLKNHNPVVMSEEQRAKYAELMGMIDGQTLEQDSMVQIETEVDSEWCVAINES